MISFDQLDVLFALIIYTSSINIEMVYLCGWNERMQGRRKIVKGRFYTIFDFGSMPENM